MIIQQIFYKDIPALELITKTVRATVVPKQGGKMVSFQAIHSSKEYLLQNRSKKFIPMGLEDSFEHCECAGFDDMFPTIDPVSLISKDGVTLSYPDHGEVCRLPFTAEVCENTLVLRAQSAALGYAYEKVFTEDADGGLRISYCIENRAPRDMDVLWAGHFLVNVEKGGKLLLPFPNGEPTDVVADLTGKWQVGARVPLGEKLLLADWREDVPDCRKVYFPRKAPEGYIAYQGPLGDVLMMEFDSTQLPYIGLWINLGYLHGDYCVGLEPASVGYDTVKNAEAYGQKDILKKNTCKKFFLKLSIK